LIKLGMIWDWEWSGLGLWRMGRRFWGK